MSFFNVLLEIPSVSCLPSELFKFQIRAPFLGTLPCDSSTYTTPLLEHVHTVQLVCWTLASWMVQLYLVYLYISSEYHALHRVNSKNIY